MASDDRGAVEHTVTRPPGTRRSSAQTHAVASACLPGLGQWLQGRRLAAAIHFGTVAVYVAAALATDSHQALWLAVLWNGWSAVEAWLHGAGSLPHDGDG
jgi:hypothetical protein